MSRARVPHLRRPDLRRAHRPWARVLAAVATVTILAGCGLRLETPDPEPLVPDAVEEVRQRATADAVSLGVLAGRIAAGGTDPALVAVATQVQDLSDAHLTALGGVYEGAEASEDAAGSESPGSGSSGDGSALPDAAGTPTPEPTATTDPPGLAAVGPPNLVALLAETSASARADAAAVPDGPLARVLASVSVSRLLLADSVSTLAGLPGVGPVTGTDGAQDQAEGPPVLGGPFDVPTELPEGVTQQEVAALVQSEDAVGLTWEVVAARRSGDERILAAARAALHRERAEDWAEVGLIAGTGLDPRRSSYALPREITDAAADPAATAATLAALEGDLAASYASLVATAATGGRTPLIDAVADASRAQVGLTGILPAFPGLPEQVASPVG